jgi:hypothetical protein
MREAGLDDKARSHLWLLSEDLEIMNDALASIRI